jgi:transcriptional regulator with XRE-family HTH domain
LRPYYLCGDVIGSPIKAGYCQFGVPDISLGGGILELHNLRRQIRKRLGLSTYEMEENSKKFAAVAGIPDLKIDHSWLSRIEMEDRATPSLHKLVSLSFHWGISIFEAFKLFGLDLDRLLQIYLTLHSPTKTQAMTLTDEWLRIAFFPLHFKYRPKETALASHVIKQFRELPPEMFQLLDLGNRFQYAFYGTEDEPYLEPLVPRGSILLIDVHQSRLANNGWINEYDRQKYLIEMRDGLQVSYAEIHKNELTLVPHSLSPSKPLKVAYPRDAEIVGQVIWWAPPIAISADTQNSASEKPLRLRQAKCNSKSVSLNLDML